MKYSVKAAFDCDIEIVTGIDGDVWDINGPHFTRLNVNGENDIKSVCGITSEKNIAVKTEQIVRLTFKAERRTECDDMSVLEHIGFSAKKGESYAFTQIAAVTTSADDNKFDVDIAQLDYDEIKNGLNHYLSFEPLISYGWYRECMKVMEVYQFNGF